MQGSTRACNLSNPLPKSLIPRTAELDSFSSVRLGKRLPKSLMLISSELNESSIDLTEVKSSLPDIRWRFSSLIRSWINSRPSSSRSRGNDCSEPSSSKIDGSELDPHVLMSDDSTNNWADFDQNIRRDHRNWTIKLLTWTHPKKAASTNTRGSTDM